MSGQIPNRLLENARALALERRYDEALRILDGLLAASPSAIDALILRGCIEDMHADAEDLAPSERTIHKNAARESFEEALRREPGCIWALTDLGDWYRFDNQPAEALEYYDRAIALLEQGKFWRSLSEEAEEAYWAKAELLDELGHSGDAEQCRRRGRGFKPSSRLLGAPVLRLRR